MQPEFLNRVTVRLWALSVVCVGMAAAAVTAAPRAVDFNRDIRPILSGHCYACHGPDQNTRKAGLRLDDRASAFAELKSGKRALVAGDSSRSELVRRITTEDPDDRMPPAAAGKPLSADQVALLGRWVAEGAVWSGHWAYSKPVRPSVPVVKSQASVKNEIDAFILAKLENANLQPSPPASKEKLLRRVTFDLTGLPPTVDELDAFLADGTPEACEKVVDRLLESKQYGERQAMFWLDLARYGETQGYHHDSHRDMFHWRDWVINAFNQNMPFDRFTIEQLAGDLLPEAKREQMIATGFHRNEMTTSEGGAIPEEYAVKYVVGRVDTTARVWMGTSLACAECHDHKYDPITQKEFYEFFAYFNTIAENGMDQEPNPAPRLLLSTPDQERKLADYDQQIAALDLARKAFVEPANPVHDAAQRDWEQKHREKNVGGWTPLTPASVHSKNGATLAVLADSSVIASGSNPDRDVYELTIPTNLEGITGVRLEAIPDAALPKKKAGRSDDGEFILSRFEAEVRRAQTATNQWKAPLLGAWHLLGPFKPGSVQAGYETAFGPESNLDLAAAFGPDNLKWAKPDWAAEDRPHPLPGSAGATHYLYRTVESPTAQSAQLTIDGAGPVQVWLNWKRVWTNGVMASGTASEPIGLALKPGENQLLIKCVNATDKTAVQVRLQDETGFWQSVDWAAAVADYSRPGYQVNGILDERIETGWSVAGKDDPGQGTHFAWLRPKSTLLWGSPLILRVRLHFDAPVPKRALGKFRLAASTGKTLEEFFGLPDSIRSALVSEARSEAAKLEVQRYYRENFVTEAKEITQLLNEKRRERDNFRNSIPVAMIMKEMEKPRETRLLIRGQYNKPGEKVSPGVPHAILPMPSDLPRNRLGLARWLVHSDHPLTSRVVVNQYWQQFFGTGLVKTSEDFGSQGEWPSHPELLDWLATEFVRSGWNIKKMHRLIVTSGTYRQDSIVTKELLERDPGNRFLGRFPRLRLDGEVIRDNALAISGLLNPRIGGPSVYPYQPPGLWEQVAFEGTRSWEQSKGEDNYRRGLYVYWRRSIPYASFVTFDAPSRETCTVRRPRTNTPLQALAVMNDPVYVEASRAFGYRILKQGGATLTDKIKFAFRACLARPPSPDEIQRLETAFTSELGQFEKNRVAANQLIHVGAAPPPVDVDICELAAWTLMANILLNLDETLTKG